MRSSKWIIFLCLIFNLLMQTSSTTSVIDITKATDFVSVEPTHTLTKIRGPSVIRLNNTEDTKDGRMLEELDLVEMALTTLKVAYVVVPFAFPQAAFTYKSVSGFLAMTGIMMTVVNTLFEATQPDLYTTQSIDINIFNNRDVTIANPDVIMFSGAVQDIFRVIPFNQTGKIVLTTPFEGLMPTSDHISCIILIPHAKSKNNIILFIEKKQASIQLKIDYGIPRARGDYRESDVLTTGTAIPQFTWQYIQTTTNTDLVVLLGGGMNPSIYIHYLETSLKRIPDPNQVQPGIYWMRMLKTELYLNPYVTWNRLSYTNSDSLKWKLTLASTLKSDEFFLESVSRPGQFLMSFFYWKGVPNSPVGSDDSFFIDVLPRNPTPTGFSEENFRWKVVKDETGRFTIQSVYALSFYAIPQYLSTRQCKNDNGDMYAVLRECEHNKIAKLTSLDQELFSKGPDYNGHQHIYLDTVGPKEVITFNGDTWTGI
jgi:hypothetical protein